MNKRGLKAETQQKLTTSTLVKWVCEQLDRKPDQKKKSDKKQI